MIADLTTRIRNPFFIRFLSGVNRRMRGMLCLMGGVCLFCVSFASGQTTDNWNGGTGNWSTPGNWSAGVPNGNFNVFIDAGNPLTSIVTLDINAAVNNLTIDSDDSLAISNNHALTVNGSSISNAGNISLNSGNNATDLIIGSSSVTLNGAGTLTMGNNSANFIFGSVGTNVFKNQETIQGAGNIGEGQLTLSNSGTINANDGGANALIVQTSGGTTNTGTLEATNGSTLVLTGASGGNFTNTGGTIKATGTGSVVALESGVTVTGGTLTTSSGGIIETPGGNTATLSGLTNSGTYSVNDNSTTILQGTITNTGSIQLNSGNNATQLKINGNVTLAGSGSVTMGNNSANLILGTAGSNVLTNQQTIQGAGNIGDGQMTLSNSGTINANDGGANALIVQTSGGTTNTGTIEATNGSTLVLTGASGGNFINTGGTIKANGTSSTVALESGVNITGGTLTTSLGGIIETPGGHTATLNGLTNSGTYSVNDNSTTILQGTITNTGSIQLNSGNDATNLKISGNVTLAGSGTVTMGNNSANFILGNSTGSEILTSANTIQGAGNIGDGFMGFVNTGKVIANQSNVLFIDTDSSAFNNKGTVQANTGSTLEILGPAGSFTNLNSSTSTLTGGTYIADGTIQFGTSNATANDIVTNAANLTLSGTSSQILDQFGNNALANLSTNASGGALTINSGRNFTTAGNFTNNGTLTVGSSNSKFDVNGNLTNFSGTTLSGGTYNLTGTLQFNGANIVTNAASITLTGASGQIISQTGANALANFATNASNGKFTIAGTRTFTTKGNFTNNGTLTTSASGSKFDVNGNLTNFSGTTLTGGTYNMTGTLQFNGANIVTNAANITLTGISSQIVDQSTNNALANFATNSSGASFTINSGRNFTTAGNFTNNGTLAVGSTNSKFDVNGNLTNFSGTTLTGGTYNLTGTLQFNGANVVTNAANLTLTGISSQIIDQSGNNGLANFATNASTGSFTINGNRNFTTTGSFSNAGLFTVASGSTFTVGGSGSLTQASGTTTDDGTLSVGSLFSVQAGSLFGKGTISGSVQSSGVVTPGDSSTKTGILTDKGAYTQTSTGALDISIGGTTAGTKFDELNPTTASLNGTLNVSLINGFVPTIGSTFKIMNFNSETGTFATVNGLSINSSEHFTITYQGADVLLTVVSGPMSPWSSSLSRSWNKGRTPPELLAGNRSRGWYRDPWQSTNFGGEYGVTRPLVRAGDSFPIVGKARYGNPQSRLSPSMLRWSYGADSDIAPRANVNRSQSLAGHGVLSQGGQKYRNPLLTALPTEASFAPAHFSTESSSSAVSSSVRQPFAASAPPLQTVSQGATFNHVSVQSWRVPSTAPVPNSFVRHPLTGFSLAAATPSVFKNGFLPTLQPMNLNNNFVVASARGGYLPYQRGMSRLTTQVVGLASNSPSLRYNTSFAYPGSTSASNVFTGSGHSSPRGRGVPYGAAGYRGTSVRRSFSVSLWNLISKPKLGFDMP